MNPLLPTPLLPPRPPLAELKAVARDAANGLPADFRRGGLRDVKAPTLRWIAQLGLRTGLVPPEQRALVTQVIRTLNWPCVIAACEADADDERLLLYVAAGADPDVIHRIESLPSGSPDQNRELRPVELLAALNAPVGRARTGPGNGGPR